MLAVVATLAVTQVLSAAIAVQINGAWMLAFDPDFGGTRGTSAECTLAQKDDVLTGTCGGAAALTGDIKGTTVRFEMKTGLKNEYTVTFEGQLDRSASNIAGSWTLVDEDGQRQGKFTLEKR